MEPPPQSRKFHGTDHSQNPGPLKMLHKISCRPNTEEMKVNLAFSLRSRPPETVYIMCKQIFQHK